MKQRPRSEAIYRSSCQLIPGGVNSPTRAFPDLSLLPMIVESGKGSRIWDVDGNSYIDYCCSWGALILGHAHPKVVAAAQERVAKGCGFGIATESEERLARKMAGFIPHLEKMRFVSSGTEATMSALRLARGFTQKKGIIKCDGHYHGHVDALLVCAGSGVGHINTEASSKGIPPEVVNQTYSLPFNDCEAFSAFFRTHDDIAAVIVEPIAGNMGVVPATPEFLQFLREETQKRGILLIFDEVITGFRVGLQGAAGLYGITPDLSCFGKIIGGGFPAAAFGGRREIMDCLAPLGEVYQAGTLSGHPVAMAAGYAALSELEVPGFYEDLQAKTDYLLQPLEEAMSELGCIQRCGSMFTLFFGPKEVKNREDLKKTDSALFKSCFHTLFEQGIYIPPSPYETWVISSAHTYADLEITQEKILAFLSTCTVGYKY